MRRMALVFSVLCLLIGVPARAEPGVNAAKVPVADPAMQAAFTHARTALDTFLAKLAHPPEGTDHYAVKIGIKDTSAGFAVVRPGDGEGTEYFWIGKIEAVGDGFTGLVHNEPVSVRNIAYNQKIRFGRDDIADWVYFDKGKMKGNFTACPALAHSPEALAELRQKVGLVCD